MASYSFGWHPSPPDIRDRLFRIKSLVGALPTSIDLSAQFSRPGNLYQYKLGSCGPQSLAKDILSSLFRQGNQAAPVPSRLFLYWVTRYLMGTLNQDSGVNNRSMLKALAQFGWADEALCPYDEAMFMQRPPQAAFDQAMTRAKNSGGSPAIEYLSVAQNLETMKGCLAGGDPFIFGHTVYQSYLDATSGDVPMPMQTAGDKVAGGHDTWFCGYDDATQRFTFLNHWPGWGRGIGFGTIPYAYATNPKLAGDFWTVRRLGAPAPVPTPPAPPVPVDPSVIVSLEAKDAAGNIVQRFVPAK